VRILILKEAERQYDRADAWWRQNRDAKDLFADEFEQALQHLAVAPETGQPYRAKRGKLIRRWRMNKTRYHVYYRHDREKQLLVVYSVWSAVRGRGPRLR
jgi:plasmid stabilization system protein ParE